MEQQKDNLPGTETEQTAAETAVQEPSVPDTQRYAQPEIDDTPIADDDDDAPTEWVPTRFEKKIKAIPDKQWNLYQTLVGTALGLLTVFVLHFSREGFSLPFIACVVLVLAGPNMFENRARRRLNRLRIVMVIVLAVGIVVMTLIHGINNGFQFFQKDQEASEAALRLIFSGRV